MDYREVIESKYSRLPWEKLLHDIFKSKAEFFANPAVVSANKDIVRGVYYIGKITLADNNLIAVYEVKLSEKVEINRMKRGIRDLLVPEWRNGGFAGAFMLCYKESESVLRFSYVSEDWSFDEDGKMRKNSTDPKRYTYLLGEGHRSRTAIQRFDDLRKSKLRLKDVTDAFSVEALSKAFFDGYRNIYADIVEYITGYRYEKQGNKWVNTKKHEPNEAIYSQFGHFKDPEKSIRDYIKNLMGRLVFLQFLQKKGWMGVPADKSWGEGDKEFMQHLFTNSAFQDDFIEAVLEPLFDDINTKREGDLVSNPNVGSNIKVPYLNGGLFERNAEDETTVVLPKEYFEKIFNFFSWYNFTIDENDPDDQEVGVDPEMLGRIFENLLEDNKDKGAFYTPKEIVEYMCRESLIAYLQTGYQGATELQDIRNFVLTHTIEPIEHIKDDLDEKLKNVKICDPAIGSGAFPMGMLKELYLCRSAIEGTDQSKAAEIKRHIIQNNIYGVDIERGAVDIARLRFWLSLVVDEETPEALPNLDFKIMQGNSLLEQYKGVDLSNLMKLKKENDDTIELTFFDDFTDNYRRELNNLMKQYYDCDSAIKKKRLRKQIKDNVMAQVKERHYDVDLSNVDIAGNSDFFLWHTWFSDVFKNGGFDIVVGNPPYGLINKKQNQDKGIKVTDEVLLYYKTSPMYRDSQGGMLNIFRLFVVLGGNLLRSNGIFCEIFPLAFACDVSSSKLRKHILTQYNVIALEVFPERDDPNKRVFASAKMSVCILFFAKNRPSNAFSLRISRRPYVEEKKKRSYFSLDQICEIDNKNYTIPLTETEDSNLLVKIYSNSVPFSKFGKCNTGEIDMTFYKKAFSKNVSDKKMLRGANIDRYVEREEISQGETFFVNEAIAKQIRKSFKTDLYDTDRIIMQGITGVNESQRLKMTLAKNTYCANSVNYCIFDNSIEAKSFLALFNSKLFNYIFKLLSTNSNVNGYEVDNLPIAKNFIEADRSQLVTLVSAILAKKKKNIDADTLNEECTIDNIVYRLYGLSPDEIAIIEG